MNKRVASLFQGLLSVVLMLALVLPSVAAPHIAWANLGGGETGAGGFESDVGEGPDGQSSAEAAAAAAEAAGQAANDAAAAGLSANAPEGVSVKGSDATPNSDPNNPTVDVDFGNGQTVSGVSPQAAQAMMDAVAAGLAPATNGQTPGFNPSATAEAHATGKAGIDGVVGNVSATLGSAASVAAAESKAAIGLAAAQAAADATAKSMNPFGAAPAVNSLSFTTLSADEALSAASKHPAMFSPQPLSTSLPAGFTFSPPTPTSRTFSTTPIGGKTTAQTFSLDNATIDATSFSLGKQLGVPSMPGFDAPIGETHSPTKSDDTSKNQYAQYALGMEIGRMATQKSLAESKYNDLTNNLSFNPATQNTQMAMLDATKAEIDAWAATIDARVDPTTQNQAVATLSQSKATTIGQIADQIANTTDDSKATQLSKSLAEAIASYDSKISAAKSSVEAAQHALSTAENNARASLYGPPADPPATQFATTLDTKFVDDLLGVPLGQRALTPATTMVVDILSFVPVVNITQQLAITVTPTPVVNALAEAVPGVKSVDAYINDQPASTVIGLLALDGLSLGFGKAVSVGLGIAGSIAGKTSIGAPSSTAGKAAAAPSAASTAGKTASNSAGKNLSLSYNPTNNTVTVHAPISPATVAEGRIAGTAAKSADNVATPSSLAGKAADDVASPSSAPGKAPTAASDNTTSPAASTPASTAAKSADDVAAPSSLAGKAADDVAAPASPTSSKAPTAANDNVPANTPANANSLGARSATTPTSVATKADDVAAPVSTPTAAPTVPGVTVADALVGPQAAPTSLAGRLSLSASQLADTLGIPASVAPASASVASRSTSAALAVAQALSAPVSPASLAKSLAGIADDFATAISRTADDISISTPTSISTNPAAKSIGNTSPAPSAVAGAPAKSATPVGITAPVAAPVSVTPTSAQTAPVTQVAAQPAAQTTAAPAANQTAPATTQTSPTQTAATPASNQTAPTTAQTNPTAPAATQPTTATPTFAPTDLGKYTVTPSTQATPATEVALGLKSLGEPTSKMQNDAAAAGFNIESPQQAVAIGIAHEVSPQTRDAIVDAYTRDGNFDSLPDSIIAEPAAFINAIANEAAGKNRSVAQQIAFANYLSSVTVDKKAYDTMANPQTRAAMTELAKQLTNGTIAAKRGLDVAAPAKTANHFYASYITPSWAKTLTDVVKVGDFTKTITGLSSKETSPTKQGTKSVLERIDQAALFSRDSLADMPAPTQTLVAFADKLSKSTPASLALEVQAAAANRIANALPQTKAPVAEPAVATPSAPTAANPGAQTQAPAQTTAGQDSIITKDSTDAQVQDFWAKRQPSKAHANIDEVNPRLLKAEAMGVQAFEAKNPTLKVTIQGPSSGVRTSGSVANHGKQADGHGGALDVVIYDTVTGARYSNHSYAKYRGNISPRKASPVYQQLFNDTVIAAYHIDPVLAKSLRFGGYFLDSNPLDLMHTDVLSHKPHAGGKTLSGFTDVQMKRYGITDNYPLKSWDNVKTLADDRYNNPNQSVTPTVATPVQTAPEVTTAVPTSRPDAIPATISPSAPISPTPAQVVAPSVPTPSTVSGSPTTNTNTAAPNNTTGYPSTPGQGDTNISPTTNAGIPPDFQSTGGTGPVAGRGTGLANSVLSPMYAFFAAIAVGINALFGADEDDNAEADTDTTAPNASSVTFDPNGINGDVPGSNDGFDESDGKPSKDGSEPGTTANQENAPISPTARVNSNLDLNSYMSNGTSSTKTTVSVLIQVDGNTGDLYFDIAGEYEDGIYYDMSEADEDAEEDKDYGVETQRIVLDDPRLNILYSDGTYAPVVIDGVWYESADDPNYVYTVEYYLDGELVAAADNAGVLPEGNPLTNLLGNLFSSSDEYGLEDVDTITRALVDPDEQVPADEYYIYRVYLNGGGTRSTTVPRYTSYRFMSERFAETGFTGNVTALIAESIEVPPPSRGGVSAIVDTFKKIGLAVVDIFRDDEAENPVVTDFGNLTPSDDGEITMADIRNVTVLLDVEAECPLAPGLDRPYLYEIVIAQAAISGATTDQAFRAVRCGGGDKADFVEQIAAHFETFDGVGTIDRQAMSDMIRFALFKDLDLSFLLENDEPGESTATSTPATVPDGEDQEYVPNLTNDVVFEVKAVGSQGQTLLDWSIANEIRIGSTVQLYFRWDGSDYEQCLPFLNDNGVYALKASGGKMITGNTESEGYDVPEANTTYRIECGGQRNNEFGVDDRSIKVIIE